MVFIVPCLILIDEILKPMCEYHLRKIGVHDTGIGDPSIIREDGRIVSPVWTDLKV